MVKLNSVKVCVVGLGYVGLPLAVEFGKKIKTVGYDSNKERILQLTTKYDKTNEVSKDGFESSTYLTFSSQEQDLLNCNVYVIAVPTPVDEQNKPDLTNLVEASKFVGKLLLPGDTVIYESTVYPGATEEICVPLLEATSGMQLNKDFYCGYSPERINPGDKLRTISSIIKITSGSSPSAAKFIDELYNIIVDAGTFPVSSIKVAEAAKIIENTQRDINIALMNELSEIFHRLDIDTTEVLEAAKSKWNFIDFTPGLVGGHCIGVDPYYLAHKAKSLNFEPEMILSGRRTNDAMPAHISTRLIKALIERKIQVHGAKILIMGLTFKENCPDIRNSKVIDLVAEIMEYRCDISIFDPWVNYDNKEVQFYNNSDDLPADTFDAVIVAVAHDEFKRLGVDFIKKVSTKNRFIFDLKSIFDMKDSDQRL